MNKRQTTTASLVLSALCAALLAVCSWLTVPATVSFTLQTFGLFAALLIGGGRQGTMAVAAYLLLGAVGVPVFAGFRGGPGVLFGATGGYLLGFLLTALLYWAVTARLGEKPAVCAVTLAAGQVLSYALGTVWFWVVYNRQSGVIGLGTVLSICVVPFVLPDLLKWLLALYIAPRIKKRIKL